MRSAAGGSSQHNSHVRRAWPAAERALVLLRRCSRLAPARPPSPGLPGLQGQQPPPIAFLRHPRVFEVLLQNLFSPGRQLQPEAAAAYAGLLALAAAADDQRPSGPADGPAATGAAATEGGEAAAAEEQQQQGQQQQQQEARQQVQQPQGGGQLDLSAVPATRAALEAAAELAQRVMRDQKAQPADMEAAAAVLEYPCCAAGAWWERAGAGRSDCRRHLLLERSAAAAAGTRSIGSAGWLTRPCPPACPACPSARRAGLLRALGAQLARPEYWQTAYHLQRSPPFLQLLALLVPRQPGLHGALLGLLGRALGALGNANHDMAKGFLSVAVQVRWQGWVGWLPEVERLATAFRGAAA